MSSYIGRHASYYDVFYAAKPYEEEAHFVASCLEEQGINKGAHLLELACGTGKHARHFHKLGYDVTAGDYSPDMIEVARSKAADLDIRFVQQDMRCLTKPVTPFDAVVCLFDSIGYVQTDQALKQVFEGVYASLRDNGVFIFEFWHEPAMVNGFDPVRVRRFSVEGGSLLRISETELMPEQHLAEVSYNIYDLSDDGTFHHVEETQINRYFTVSEMECWASAMGFEPLRFYPGFERGRDVDDDTWHVVTVWRKK